MPLFTATFLVGLVSASGILVLLVGLHATDDFRRLEPLGAIVWGTERATAMQAGAQETIAEGAITGSSVGDFYASPDNVSLPYSKIDLRDSRNTTGITPSQSPIEGAIMIDNDDLALATSSAIDVAVWPALEVRLNAPMRLIP